MTADRGGVYVGNAAADGAERRGWIVGHFLPDGDPRASRDVEIKWGDHPAGDERAEWQVSEQRTTVVVLVHGRFSLRFDTGPVTLAAPGDYAMWGKGVAHSWRAEEASVVLTVRWPSQPQ